ncbi:carbonic anhydrase CynT [Acrasis kona]|uniref:Carbonic anhydrase n=1 Tax=Acrasis kona TaxID=1008807 RepID=A0AAW2Z394_9EUKA
MSLNAVETAIQQLDRAHKYADHCNTVYAKRFKEENKSKGMPGPEPTKKVAIITCMDARLDVFSMFGLELAESHVIRVGGGRAPDAIRSLVASEQVLETEEIMVVHHTDCGFSHAKTHDELYNLVKTGLGGKINVECIPFQPILNGFEQSVREDLEFLRTSPYVKKNAVISGWVYDTFNGTIKEVL